MIFDSRFLKNIHYQGIHKSYEYKNSYDNKFYTLKLKWNKWYPNLESTFKVFIGAHDITSLGSAQMNRIDKIIMVCY